MKKTKVVCHICSITLKFDDVPTSCVNCGTDWINTQSEELKAYFGDCVLVRNKEKGTRSVKGSLRVTSKRLLLVKESDGGVIVGQGLIGWLIAALVAHGLNKRAEKNKSLGLNILLESIASAEKADEKKNKGFIITSKDGTEYKLKCTFMKEYKMIREAIMQEAL
jgi:hypothetical protein